MWLPNQTLLDCEVKKDDPVQLESVGNGRVTAHWHDRSVPQLVQYDVAQPTDAGDFPGLPERFAENPTSLLDAFNEAVETTDPGSVRFALGCVRMGGKDGSVSATDSRQLLVQSGFVFPWDEDVLVPKTKLLGGPEFSCGQPIEVGKAGDWLAFRKGELTVWMAINKDGRFPDVSRTIPAAADAKATCRFSPADASFLADTLPRLPTDDLMNHPVTVDLNGCVAVRAKPADQNQVTEVILRNSSWSGEPTRINTNREYLARALKLGFNTVHLHGSNAPVLCEDDHRQFVWMVLDPESAIPSTKDALRIESPADPIGDVSQPMKRRNVVPKTNTPPEAASRNGHNQAAAITPEQPTGTIEQAIALRDALRDAANKGCSIKWKREPQDRRVRQWLPALEAWDAGLRIKKLIGFDATEGRRRYADRGDDPQYDYWYPLMDWGWDRERCKRVIADTGLPVPAKSACFFCPASKKPELAELSHYSPDLYQLSLALEDRYRDGKHFRGDRGTTQGLGRTFAWREHGERAGIV